MAKAREDAQAAPKQGISPETKAAIEKEVLAQGLASEPLRWSADGIPLAELTEEAALARLADLMGGWESRPWWVVLVKPGPPGHPWGI